MPNDYFRFKQFTVRQDRCAMKVGTDGMLLGAWTRYASAKRILDIGTGTGLLALIAAQRNPKALIDAVEVDVASAGQARENVAASPWNDRVRTCCADVRKWQHRGVYDLILCNPPFYRGYQTSRDLRVATAKHGLSLSLADVMEVAADRCMANARISTIVPIGRLEEMITLATGKAWYLSRKCLVQYVATKPPKRVLLEFSLRYVHEPEEEMLVVERVAGVFSPEFHALLSDLKLYADHPAPLLFR